MNWLIELIRISSRGKRKRKKRSCKRDSIEEQSSSNIRKRNNSKYFHLKKRPKQWLSKKKILFISQLLWLKKLLPKLLPFKLHLQPSSLLKLQPSTQHK